MRLTAGGCDYWDRTRPLMDGSVRPSGIDLNYIVVPLQDLFRRMVQHAEFDIAEMSMSTYVALVARGEKRFVGIPVFPSRNFRHGYLFINTGASINSPADLRGKKIGVPHYQMTAALWIRALIQHDFGVHPRELQWFTGGMNKPGFVERTDLSLPADINLQEIPEDRHLEEMLEKGDIDALISPVRPAALIAGDDRVERMFPDYRKAEQDYFRRTGIFPIMHTVVLRRELYERDPWITVSIYEAYEKAKRLSKARLLVTGPLAVGLPWLTADLEEIDEVFGGEDPFAYGIDANRKVLETITQISEEQGLATRRVELEELFAAECFVEPAIGEAA